MSSISSKKINKKLLIPIILVFLVVVVYFIYQAFFVHTEVKLNSKSNTYVSKTKLGQYIDLINKENLTFNTNINNELLLNSKDFSVNINPSSGIGRKNPFLP